MNPTEFYRVLYSLDEHKMRNFFRGRTEDDRRAPAPIVHELGSKADISPIYIPIEVIPEFNVIADSVQKGTPLGIAVQKYAGLLETHHARIEAYGRCLAIAAFATLEAEDLSQLLWVRPASADAEEILNERGRNLYAIYQNIGCHYRKNYAWWAKYHAKLEGGTTPRRTDQETIQSFCLYFSVNGRYDKTSVREKLLSLPLLLDMEVFHLLELPPLNGPANHDQYCYPLEQCGFRRWDQALIEMAKRGEIDRQRLFDTLFNFVRKNRDDFYVEWYLNIYRNSIPTKNEHAEAIQELLEGIIPHIKKRSLSGFLEVLVETNAILNRPVRSESCRGFLQSLTGSGKVAKLAKKLLEL